MAKTFLGAKDEQILGVRLVVSQEFLHEDFTHSVLTVKIFCPMCLEPVLKMKASLQRAEGSFSIVILF